MSYGLLRTILTILLYAGVLLFFVPHLTGKASSTLMFNIAGAGMAVVCGLLRCYLTEEEERAHPHAHYHV